MKKLILIYVCLLIAAIAGQAHAGDKAPFGIMCTVGNAPATIVNLNCEGKMTDRGYDPWWCEGKINESLLAKADGNYGEGRFNLRVTYLPGNFTGMTPIKINDLLVYCETMEEYKDRKDNEEFQRRLKKGELFKPNQFRQRNQKVARTPLKNSKQYLVSILRNKTFEQSQEHNFKIKEQ